MKLYMQLSDVQDEVATGVTFITIDLKRSDLDLPPNDFFERFLRPALFQLKNTQEEREAQIKEKQS